MKQFETLLKSEVKKVNKLNQGLLGEWSAHQIDEYWVQVDCDLFDNEYEKIINHATLMVCMLDRRRSYVQKNVL